jgi:hypothetical protein
MAQSIKVDSSRTLPQSNVIVVGVIVSYLGLLAAHGNDHEPGPNKIHFEFTKMTGDLGSPQCSWTLNESTGKANYELIKEDRNTEFVLRMRSNGTSYFLANREHSFESKSYPYLFWRWRVSKLPEKGDVRKHAILIGENLNDQAAQVLVVFQGRRVLSYVWDSTAPVGTEVDEPSLVATIKTRVMESGTKNIESWVSNRVNIHDDYKRRYGHEPGKVEGVLLQCNSNHTRSSSCADFGSIFVSDENGF